MEDKRCPACGETKAASSFGRNRSLRDGLSFYCLACSRERNNAWYRKARRRLAAEVRDLSWVPDGFRWCPACEQAVAHEEYVRNKSTTSGFGSRCRACDSRSNSESYFYRRYGLTKKQIADMRAAQEDRCAICGEASPEHLDHDHESGAARALLCQRCNQGLGLLRDDPTVLRAAADYVERHRDLQRGRRSRPLRTRRREVTHPVARPCTGSGSAGSGTGHPDRSRPGA